MSCKLHIMSCVSCARYLPQNVNRQHSGFRFGTWHSVDVQSLAALDYMFRSGMQYRMSREPSKGKKSSLTVCRYRVCEYPAVASYGLLQYGSDYHVVRRPISSKVRVDSDCFVVLIHQNGRPGAPAKRKHHRYCSVEISSINFGLIQRP